MNRRVIRAAEDDRASWNRNGDVPLAFVMPFLHRYT